VYLNKFATGLEPIDLTQSDEFTSLLQSAQDLDIDVTLPVRYQSRNIVLNGLRFHVLEWGEPWLPPLLFLHGGNQTAHSWDLVSLHLANRYHIIAVDQRGHGDSEWPRDGEASRHPMADDARQLIDMFELRQPIIFGHSMGGTVTMTLLLAHPGIAKRAVLVDVGPEVSNAGRQSIRGFVNNAREFASMGEYVERVSAYDPFRSHEHIKRTLVYNILKRADGKFVSKHDPRRGTIAETEAPASHAPSLDDVRSITCPVLVVRGGQSNILLPDAAERFVAALPAGRLVTVLNCGHNVHSQNTVGFLDAVVPFIEEA
jgi:pimeloyl-ACP methyl ester carboxylesterase